jgi:hypothetical protein
MFPVFSLVSGNSGLMITETGSLETASTANTACADSLSVGRSALKSPGIRPFSRTAVHLGLAPEARNHSLTPGFLCGRSPGPFGTHFAFDKQISSLAERRQTQVCNSSWLAEIQARNK